MKNIIKITLGDYFGHYIKEDYFFKCNETLKELISIYDEAERKSNFKFVDQVAHNYEDKYLHLDQYKILKEAGLNFSNIWGEDEESIVQILIEDGYIDIKSADKFLTLFFEFLKIVEPNIQYEKILNDTPTFPYSMGYGLYSI